MENQTVTVKAIIAFPSLTQEIQFKGAPTGKYGTQLANLSDAAVEKLEELGVSVKFKDDDYGRGRFIDCKSLYPIDNSKFPTIMESDGKTMFSGPIESIGYGTEVRAKLKLYAGRDGVVRPSIQKLYIDRLAEPDVSLDDDTMEAAL